LVYSATTCGKVQAAPVAKYKGLVHSGRRLTCPNLGGNTMATSTFTFEGQLFTEVAHQYAESSPKPLHKLVEELQAEGPIMQVGNHLYRVGSRKLLLLEPTEHEPFYTLYERALH
jgi:hypothetical protein